MKINKSFEFEKSLLESKQYHFLETFKKLTLLAEDAVRLGALGDDNSVRVVMDQLKQVWSNLPDDFTELNGVLDDESAHILNVLNKNFKKALTFIYAWNKRFEPILDNDSFRNSYDGLHYLIDSRIPPIWNWDIDLIVLFSRQKHKLAKLLVERGQKKILIVTGRIDKKFLEEAKSALFGGGLTLPKRIHIIETPTSNSQANGIIKLIESLCDSHTKVSLNNNTHRVFSASNTLQRIRNAPYFLGALDIDGLRNEISTKPVVIVSPGPSLSKNIEVLKANESKGLIVAVAQSVPALLKHNVQPDYVVVLDSQDYSGILEGLSYEKTTGIFIDTVHESFLKYPFRQIAINFSCNSPSQFTDGLGARRVTIDGGSVSVFAFNLMVYLNASSVGMIGQDLSVGNKNYYVGDGWNSFYTEEENLIKDDEVNWNKKPKWTLKGYYGGTVFTRGDYWIYHAQLVTSAKNIKKLAGQIGIYNCTEGGAFIDGFEHVTLEHFFLNVGDPDLVKPSHKKNLSESTLKQRMADLSRYFKQLKSKCLAVNELLDEGDEIFSGKKNVKYLTINSTKIQEAILENHELSNCAYQYLDEIDKRLIRNKTIKDDHTISRDIYRNLKIDNEKLIRSCDDILVYLRNFKPVFGEKC